MKDLQTNGTKQIHANDKGVDKNFAHFVQEIKSKIQAAQNLALKAVNKELIALYADIGRLIVERQEKFGWGKGIVENLAAQLQSEMEGLQGFSPQNLWNMRLYFLTYRHNEILQTLSREIPWSHNVLIFQNPAQSPSQATPHAKGNQRAAERIFQ